MELECSGKNLGYIAIWQRIQKIYNITVKQRTVLNIQWLLDPDGVQARKRNRLKRRIYTTPGLIFIWHVDGHDRLKDFGFYIHGAIDGFSKKLLWIEVATTNKDPYVIAYYYLKTIMKFIPTLVRSDAVTENVVIESLHTALRTGQPDDLSGEKSFLIGKKRS